MSDALNIDAASFLATKQAVAKPQPTKDMIAARKTAEDFEAVFINEMLGSMFEGIKTDGPFGGGPSEGIYRSLLIDEYSRDLAKNGGFGLADAVTREILAMQEGRK